MKCRYCQGVTRVVVTEHRDDGTHRWLRCQVCDQLTRTLEDYWPRKRGPKPGTPRTGPGPRGERNGWSVLSEADVRQLRQQAASGTPQKQLAQRYGIAPATVSRIVTRKAWSHVS
jgi:hypothetical protein